MDTNGLLYWHTHTYTHSTETFGYQYELLGMFYKPFLSQPTTDKFNLCLDLSTTAIKKEKLLETYTHLS
jgi:hypothetical protein